MAKKSAPAPAPAHHVAMGGAAAAAMRASAMNVSAATMSFAANPAASQENFTPPVGTYRTKSTKQG